ncbi:MAG: DUF305 domain-containing protein [Candidatus Nanopelagicales bacterium]|jgi:uncharacterized protein (DUF305 family)
MAKKLETKINTNTIILIFIAILLAFLAGFFINNQSSNNYMGSMMQNSQNSEYSQNEVMFAAMMIPHHEQAVTMSNMALTNTTNPKVLDLAQRIKAGQEPEIIQMNTWLDGGYSMMDHSGHLMGGMLSDQDLEKLGTLKNKDFDEMFLTAMIEHHEGALQMTQMILNSSNNEVKTLADNIINSQTKEIAEMKELLANLS